MKTLPITENIPIRGGYEIVVAGGGVAGVAAALAAARAGRKVLLIEKSVMLGGLATLGLINLFVPLCNGRGRQIIRGMVDELLQLSIRHGFDTLPEDWKNGEPGPGSKARYITRYSVGIFALELAALLRDEGVELLYDSIVSQPVMKDGRCEGLVVESKSGREFYEAGVVVDATGDADVLFRAGVPTLQRGNYLSYVAHGTTLESCRKAVETGNIRFAEVSFRGGGASLYGKNHPEGMPLFEGTTARSVTDFLLINQRLLLDRIKESDRLSRNISTLPGMAQFRTTRCIEGDHILTVSDQYKHFDDSVGAIGDFEQRDFLYEVPYRCLVRSGYGNLITAGRSAAAEGYAWDVLRVIPPAILTGQAAGLAAAQAVGDGVALDKVDIPRLQKELAATGVVIHFDDRWISDATGEKGEDFGHL